MDCTIRVAKNKGADQLRRYREADLRLCFRICQNPVFSRRGSNDDNKYSIKDVQDEKREIKHIIKVQKTVDTNHCLYNNN